MLRLRLLLGQSKRRRGVATRAKDAPEIAPASVPFLNEMRRPTSPASESQSGSAEGGKKKKSKGTNERGNKVILKYERSPSVAFSPYVKGGGFTCCPSASYCCGLLRSGRLAERIGGTILHPALAKLESEIYSLGCSVD